MSQPPRAAWLEFFSGVDKAATPPERAYTDADLLRDLGRSPPQTLVPQRDSDANRDVLASRGSALRHSSCLQLRTGANLIRQLVSEYIPRVFCTTLPHVVGGLVFSGQALWRGRKEDFEPVSLDLYITMMASRCE